jgi:hypothetical protein
LIGLAGAGANHQLYEQPTVPHNKNPMTSPGVEHESMVLWYSNINLQTALPKLPEVDSEPLKGSDVDVEQREPTVLVVPSVNVESTALNNFDELSTTVVAVKPLAFYGVKMQPATTQNAKPGADIMRIQVQEICPQLCNEGQTKKLVRVSRK